MLHSMQKSALCTDSDSFGQTDAPIKFAGWQAFLFIGARGVDMILGLKLMGNQ